MADEVRAGAEARLRELVERGAWTEVEALAEMLLGRDAQCVPALVARALAHEAAAARAALAAHPEDPWARDLLMWRLHRAGDIPGAEAVARGTLERWPGEAGALMLRGLAARARKDLPDAIALLRQAAEHTARRDAREALLETLRLAQDWPAAEALADALLLEAPGLAGAVLVRGLARRAHGDVEGATADLSSLPDELAALNALMWMRHDAGDSVAVDVLATRILNRAPRDHAALVLRGIAARQRRDLPAAIASFWQAHVQNPADGWARDSLMEACREAEAWADAEALADAALQADPSHARARITRGIAREKRGDIAGAVADLAMLPDDLWASSTLMWIHNRAGDTEAADAVAARILSARPQDLGALMLRGLVARGRQELEAAVGFFRAAATVAPADPWPAGALLEACRDLGDWQGAEAALAGMDRGSIAVRLGMARLRRAQGRAEDAVACLQPAMAEEGATAELAVELARALLEVNRPEEALAAAEAALLREAGNAGALLVLATAARRLQDSARERAALEEATSLHPGRPEPMLALADLAWREGRSADSREILQSAASRFPSDARPLAALAQQARQAECFEDAAGLFHAALARAPQDLQAACGLIETLGSAALFDAAESTATEAEARLGVLPQLRGARIAQLRLRGHWPEALELARERIGTAPQAMPLRLWQARLELLLEGPAAAEATLAEAQPGPPGERAQLLLQRALAAEERGDEAAAMAGVLQAIEAAPEHAYIHWDAARLCILRLDLSEARRHLRAALASNAGARRALGQGSNESQSHAGQVLEELRLDPELISCLAALRMLPAPQRLSALAAVVEQNPGHTGAAMQMILALREAGRLEGAAASAQPIPRRLCQFWTEAEPLPDVAALMGSWAAHHPGWEIERFDNASALAFMEAHMPEEVVRAFRAASNPAMRADLFRLAWLLARGGVYADADDRCHMALDPLLRPGTELLLYMEDWASIGNNVMAAAPGHAIIAAAMQQVAEAILRGDRDFVWLCTGPALMTRAVAAAAAQERGMPSGVRLLRRWEMHRHVAMHAYVAYKGSKRHWLRAAFAPANGHRRRA